MNVVFSRRIDYGCDIFQSSRNNTIDAIIQVVYKMSNSNSECLMEI